jgi:hypothetical protein
MYGILAAIYCNARDRSKGFIFWASQISFIGGITITRSIGIFFYTPSFFLRNCLCQGWSRGISPAIGKV